MTQRAWDGATAGFRRLGPECPAPSVRRELPERKSPVRFPKRSVRAEEGAAVIEFALVSSLLVMVAWGVIQFGIAFHRYQGLQSAGREGARFGASSQATIGGIEDRVKQVLDEVIDTSNATYVNPCPADTSTLATGKYCINVARRDTPSASPTLLTTTGYSASAQPCNLAQGKTVVVTVYHKIRITIPLWAAGAVNASGLGEFRCET